MRGGDGRGYGSDGSGRAGDGEVEAHHGGFASDQGYSVLQILSRLDNFHADQFEVSALGNGLICDGDGVARGAVAICCRH